MMISTKVRIMHRLGLRNEGYDLSSNWWDKMRLLVADASGIYVAKMLAELEKKIKMEEGIFRIRNSLPGDTGYNLETNLEIGGVLHHIFVAWWDQDFIVLFGWSRGRWNIFWWNRPLMVRKLTMALRYYYF